MHQLRRLSKLAVDMKKQVLELNTNQQLITPPEFMQQRQQSAYQAVGRIREAEKICTKVMEIISVVWEQLIEDETTYRLAEQAWQV